jgi:hypothetical protein
MVRAASYPKMGFSTGKPTSPAHPVSEGSLAADPSKKIVPTTML